MFVAANVSNFPNLALRTFEQDQRDERLMFFFTKNSDFQMALKYGAP